MPPRPLASLSAGLLARKGGARPAMRPQFAPLAPSQAPVPPAALDDLGWNDLGHAVPAAPAPRLPLPEPRVQATPSEPGPEPAAVPAVLVERAALARAVVAPAARATVSPAEAERLAQDTRHAGRAAFTLRLDADRHLRLRLASAVANQSAQALVLQAVDALLAAMPAVDALVAALPPPPPHGQQGA